MTVKGYGVGEIRAEAAMTSDIVMHPGVTFDRLNLAVEVERRTMDVRPGMNRKYTPLLHDAITGGLLCGGRYVFDTWENVQDYWRWTHEELEFEPGVKFWDRPIFPGVDSHLWKVVGAHDFTPVDTHGVNRLERWRYTADTADAQTLLAAAWPDIRDRAKAAGLGTTWLLDQPDERQVAVFTTGVTTPEDGDLARLAASVDALALMPSLGAELDPALGLTKLFDRTSPVLSIWLPLSRQLGGAPVANPSSPPWPLPDVAPQQV